VRLREKEKNILERNWMRGGEICILVLGAVVVVVVVVVVFVVLQDPASTPMDSRVRESAFDIITGGFKTIHASKVLTTQCIESAYYTIYRRHRHLTIPYEKNFKIDEDAAATTVLKRCYGIATALLQHCYSIATRTKQIHFWKRGKSIKKKTTNVEKS